MNREKKLEAVLVIAAGFMLLFFAFKFKWLLLVAFFVAALSALSDSALHAITWFWFKLAHVLGWLNTRILLALVFYLFLFPVALVVKLFNKDGLKLKNKDVSCFSPRNHTYKAEDLENTW